MANDKKQSFFSGFLRWFIVFYILFFGIQYFFGEKEQDNQVSVAVPDVTIVPQKEDYVMGNLVNFVVQNNTESPISFNTPCEKENENLKVLYVTNYRETDITSDISEDLRSECKEDEIASFSIEPGQEKTFSSSKYNQALFSEPGNYKLEMTFEIEEESKTFISEPVLMEKPGSFRLLFRALISRPLFNILVFFTEYIPGNSYGISIILLTVLVRLLLFIPNQKAMLSQRELQKLQPKLAEIKEKNKGNQQVIAMKTMELYKTHKINPLGGFLPILLQMPFLLGIFYLIQDGIAPHLSYLLYGFYAQADLYIGDPLFLGLDLGLTQDGNGMGQIVLAVMVAVAQFAAVKISMVSAKKRNEKHGVATPKKKSDDPMAVMQNASKVMMWVMPGLVAVFTLSFPAGVGIYWVTSTIFGVGQQYFVNKSLDGPQVRKKES